MQIVEIYIDEINEINKALSTKALCIEIFMLSDLRKRNRYEKEIVIKRGV